MFRTREPQESLWQSEFLITPRKARLMRRSWAQVFRKGIIYLFNPGHSESGLNSFIILSLTHVRNNNILPLLQPLGR